MSNSLNTRSADSFFGDVVYIFSRAQAIEDGVLVNAGSMAQEAGFKWPVAFTSATWENCIAWTDEDKEKQAYQDQSGRLWDVLYMASHAIRTSNGSNEQMRFELYRVPRDGTSMKAELVTLKLIVGPGDQGEPVITIMMPNED
ncbi:MAG: DUF6573 family protein [Pseudomonadota bacterium]|nr:DUF6573 family protein [Pseudomonadota bacterium]